jgi:hypothetical protein
MSRAVVSILAETHLTLGLILPLEVLCNGQGEKRRVNAW